MGISKIHPTFSSLNKHDTFVTPGQPSGFPPSAAIRGGFLGGKTLVGWFPVTKVCVFQHTTWGLGPKKRDEQKLSNRHQRFVMFTPLDAFGFYGHFLQTSQKNSGIAWENVTLLQALMARMASQNKIYSSFSLDIFPINNILMWECSICWVISTVEAAKLQLPGAFDWNDIRM